MEKKRKVLKIEAGNTVVLTKEDMGKEMITTFSPGKTTVTIILPKK